MNRSRSEFLFGNMVEMVPGGVSSPVRSFSPHPVFFDHGKGCILRDVDGNDYVDLCMAYGPLITGHADDDVIGSIIGQSSKGTVFGAPSEPEYDLISKIIDRVPCADMVRLTNSGTEATMHAVRLARGCTSKDGIVRMKGSFHGSHDAVLSGPSVSGHHDIPASRGVPKGSVKNTYSIEYNNEEELENVLQRDDIAALIMEPVLGNTGVVTPEKGYLEKVRSMTKEHGVLLIFDEVITGARLSAGGAQEFYGVVPDICTMGKVIGGGLPIGAIAGKKDVMDNIAPSGDVYMAGTFSGNPMSAAAGNAVLSKMTSSMYRDLNNISDEFVKGLEDVITDGGEDACVQQAGSMFQIVFGISGAKNAFDVKKANTERFGRMFSAFLDSGIYMAPSQFEANFLSTVHDDISLQKVNESFEMFMRGSQ